MKQEKLLAILRLQATRGVGSILSKKIISAVGDVEQIFREKATTLQKINRIGSQTVNSLFDKENQQKAERELKYITDNNIEYYYFLDEKYPKNLKNCVDSPILLFKQGNIDLSNRRLLSIVGTRKITSYGRNFCQKLIAELSTYNPIIVSGFALGVDICAHREAIKNDLQTIAILGNGLSEIYPREHQKHKDQVLSNGGFLTEFWHDKKPIRENFLSRNRIIAGISKATVVVESARKGGALVTADIANSYNREVFATPARTTDLISEGCNNLIKNNKANLLSSAQDIVKMLNWDIEDEKSKKIVQRQLFVQLTEQEQKIYNFLNQNGKQLLDVISLECQIPVRKLASVLLQMELKGVLNPLPGKQFETRSDILSISNT